MTEQLKNRRLATSWAAYISSVSKGRSIHQFRAQYKSIANTEFLFALTSLLKLNSLYIDEDQFFRYLFEEHEAKGLGYRVAVLHSENGSEIRVYRSHGLYYLKIFSDDREVSSDKPLVIGKDIEALLNDYFGSRWMHFRLSGIHLNWTEARKITQYRPNEFELLFD
jgi:hypothetical protein